MLLQCCHADTVVSSYSDGAEQSGIGLWGAGRRRYTEDFVQFSSGGRLVFPRINVICALSSVYFYNYSRMVAVLNH